MNPVIGLLIPPSLPADYCIPADPQQFANDLFSLASVVASTTSTISQFYNEGPTTPTPDFQSYPWLKKDSNGAPIGWFVFYQGFWVWPRFMGETETDRLGKLEWWKGAVADIWAKDGGENVAVDFCHGPFWERDTDFDGRAMVSTGTLPVAGTVLNPGDNGGVDEHALTILTAQLPAHRHNIGVEGNSYISDAAENGKLRTAGTNVDFVNSSEDQVGQTRQTGDGDPVEFNNMPPYRVATAVIRTARLFYRG